MATLKQLHENLIQEEIKNNYFLSKLNEAINIGNLKAIIDPIEKMESIVKRMKFITLNFAFDRALADAKKIATIKSSSTSSEMVSKITVFYSKMWNFLSKDLPVLKKINLKDFFVNAEPDDTLAGHKDAKEIRQIIREALIEDDSAWYRRALAYITDDSEWISAIPYLNIDEFVNEFMSKTKKELEKAINLAGPIEDIKTETDEIIDDTETPSTDTEDGTQAVRNAVVAVDQVITQLREKFPEHKNKINRKLVSHLLFVKNKNFSAIEAKDLGVDVRDEVF